MMMRQPHPERSWLLHGSQVSNRPPAPSGARPGSPRAHPPLPYKHLSTQLLNRIHSFAILVFCSSSRSSPPSIQPSVSLQSERIMSNFDSAKDSAAQKAEDTKGFGQQKAGQAQQATKDAAGTTQSHAQGAAGAAGDKANQAKQASADAAGAAQSKAGQAKDGAGDKLNQAKDAMGNAFNQAKDAVTPNK